MARPIGGKCEVRVRADIIGHARIKYVGRSQSCMVENGRFIPRASYWCFCIVSRMPPHAASRTHRQNVESQCGNGGSEPAAALYGCVYN